MRPIKICLVLMLVALQYKLWFGDASVLQWMRLEKKLAAQSQQNQALKTRNQAIAADIEELKPADQSQEAQALEERARYDLGMIKQDEVYYHFAD